MKPTGEAAAVMIWSQVVAVLHGVPDGLVALGVGLWGVVLARWVFVNRENRRLPRRQPWRETLPLTLVAMLITAVLVHDRDLGLSAAAFTGLGVGWSAVLLLDLFGDRITAAFRAGFAAPAPRLPDTIQKEGQMRDSDVDVPADLAHLVDRLHDVPGRDGKV